MLRRKPCDVTVGTSHGFAERKRVLSAAANPIYDNSFAAEARVAHQDSKALFISFGSFGCTTEPHRNIVLPKAVNEGEFDSTNKLGITVASGGFSAGRLFLLIIVLRLAVAKSGGDGEDSDERSHPKCRDGLRTLRETVPRKRRCCAPGHSRM